jgi:hypothetical protein
VALAAAPDDEADANDVASVELAHLGSHLLHLTNHLVAALTNKMKSAIRNMCCFG